MADFKKPFKAVPLKRKHLQEIEEIEELEEIEEFGNSRGTEEFAHITQMDNFDHRPRGSEELDKPLWSPTNPRMVIDWGVVGLGLFIGSCLGLAYVLGGT